MRRLGEQRNVRQRHAYRPQELVNALLCVHQTGWHSRARASRFPHALNNAIRAQMTPIVFLFSDLRLLRPAYLSGRRSS